MLLGQLVRSCLKFTVVAFALTAPAEAQESRVVRGRVLAAEMGAPVSGASVFGIARHDSVRRAPLRASVTTSPTGDFAIRVDSGTHALAVIRLGFAPETLQVAGVNAHVVVRLREAPIALVPSLIQAERP